MCVSLFDEELVMGIMDSGGLYICMVMKRGGNDGENICELFACWIE